MNSIGDSIESHRQGVRYEALRESMTNEIARHLDAYRADEHGSDASLHDAAANKFITARSMLDPEDTTSIEIASLIMDSYRDKVRAESR